MFTSAANPRDQFPALKGQADVLRHFTIPLMDVFMLYSDPNNELHSSMLVAMKKSARIEEILTEHSGVVGALPAAAEFMTCTAEFLLLMQYLNRECLEQNALLFSVTIKAHVLMHSAMQSLHLNPTMGWVYMGEDFQCKMRTLMESCSAGNKPHQATAKLTKKWARAIDLTLRGAAVWRT